MESDTKNCSRTRKNLENLAQSSHPDSSGFGPASIVQAPHFVASVLITISLTVGPDFFKRHLAASSDWMNKYLINYGYTRG